MTARRRRGAPAAQQSMEFGAATAVAPVTGASDGAMPDPAPDQAPAIVCGVDEAGRGPLAGPVYAAAVVLDDDAPIDGLADSKALKPAARERLADAIRERARAWAIARAEVEEIDALNILQATMLAMRRAVEALPASHGVRPTLALVDGNRLPALPCAGRAVVRGDATVAAISAASILAKTARDQEMRRLAQAWPGYGFEIHMGYGTAAHLAALRRLGASPVHRRSFAPVRAALEAASGPTDGPLR